MGLFVATSMTMFGVYLGSWQLAGTWNEPAAWLDAGLFTATLMGIMAAHELGHWAVARAVGVRLSLPWFMPFPLWTGTLGAIMRLQQPPRTRGALLAMAASGPLVGLMAIAAVLILRLTFGGEGSGVPLTRPMLWWALSAVLPGNTPTLGTADPVGFAAWIGCLVTTMNLLPVGQLDGGHVVTALWPGQSDRVGWVALGCLVLAGWLWVGWIAWAIVLGVLGTWRPVAVLGEAPPAGSIAIAVACVGAWLLCVTPVPF